MIASIYEYWYEFIQNNIGKIKNEVDFNATDRISIDGEEVIFYGNLEMCPFLTAGIWLQTEKGIIYVYGRMPEQQFMNTIFFKEKKTAGKLHTHFSVEIGYVVKGCSRQTFYGNEVEFHEGDFWLVDQNCYHNDVYYNEELLTIYFTIPMEQLNHIVEHFDNESAVQKFFGSIVMKQKKIRQYLHFTPRLAKTEAPEVMNKIIKEIRDQKFGYETVVDGLVQRLLYELFIDYTFIVGNKEKRTFQMLMEVEIKNYIMEHCDSIKIEYLCKKFHYNEDYYNRLLKEYEGMTYSEFVRAARFERSRELLKTTKFSVEEIAQRVGFRSRSHFYDMFREMAGMTPAEYRKQEVKKSKQKS